MNEKEAKSVARNLIKENKNCSIIASIPYGKELDGILQAVEFLKIVKERLPKASNPMRIMGAGGREGLECFVFAETKKFCDEEYVNKWWEMSTIFNKEVGDVCVFE